MKRAGRTRLLRHAPVYLHFDCGDPSRFADVFRATWKRWPRRYKIAVLSYWRKQAGQQGRKWSHKSFLPYIVLTTRPPSTDGIPEDDILGCVRDAGQQMQFLSAVSTVMPEEHLATLIAHELTHVWQYATGYPFHPEDTGPFSCKECDCQEINRDNGFSEQELDEWLDAGGTAALVAETCCHDEQQEERYRAPRRPEPVAAIL